MMYIVLYAYVVCMYVCCMLYVVCCRSRSGELRCPPLAGETETETEEVNN